MVLSNDPRLIAQPGQLSLRRIELPLERAILGKHGHIHYQRTSGGDESYINAFTMAQYDEIIKDYTQRFHKWWRAKTGVETPPGFYVNETPFQYVLRVAYPYAGTLPFGPGKHHVADGILAPSYFPTHVGQILY